MPPLPPNPMGFDVVSAAAAGIFVDAIAISLRVWSRKLKQKKLVAGDYLIIVAWTIAFGDFIRKIIAYKWGVGLHIWQIEATDPSHLLDAAKITYAGFFLWNAAVTCIKLSILYVYLELFSCVTWFIWCVKAAMGLCVLFFIGFTIGLCVECTPFAANYDSSIPGAHCGISMANGFYLSGGINLFLDVVLVLLPMMVVWNLNITRLKKIGVSAMFSLGLLILVVVGFRFKLLSEENPADFIHDGEPPGILISLELYLGMISACLPFFSPPLAKMRDFFSGAKPAPATHGQSAFNRAPMGPSQEGLGLAEKSSYARSKRSDTEASVGTDSVEFALDEPEMGGAPGYRRYFKVGEVEIVERF